MAGSAQLIEVGDRVGFPVAGYGVAGNEHGEAYGNISERVSYYGRAAVSTDSGAVVWVAVTDLTYYGA
jgi:hypothetical protein